MNWQWGWLPSDPAADFGDNPVFDWIRLAMLLSTILLIPVVVRVVREQRRRADRFASGQASRFLALAIASLYITPTELVVFGTVATPRLLVGVAFNVAAWYGLHKIRQQQRRTPVVRP